MDHATWVRLAACCGEQLARPEVAGVVVTHGTDTLEETAYLLHRCVRADKPVVLTAAMRRPARHPRWPHNLCIPPVVPSGAVASRGRQSRACVLALLAFASPAGETCASCTATAYALFPGPDRA